MMLKSNKLLVRNTQPTFIDLFSGCGGLSLGLSEAGWKGKFAIEANRDAFLTFEKNFLGAGKGWDFDWDVDWLAKRPHDLIELIRRFRAELKGLRGTIDLVAGGPPCQGFSSAGRRDPSDPRNQLFKHYIEFVRLVKPRVILLENVERIRVSRRRSTRDGRRLPAYSDMLENGLRSVGYDLYSTVLRSRDYGVPQQRPRYFLIGIHEDHVQHQEKINPFEILVGRRTHFLRSKGLESEIGSFTKVEDAISDLETKKAKLEPYPGWKTFKRISKIRKPSSAYQELMRRGLVGGVPDSLRIPNHKAPTRERFERITQLCLSMGDRRGICLSDDMREQLGMKKHSFTVLHPSEPSPTLTTLPDDLLHYDEFRILTVRETARLQSFPDRFEFHGKYTTGGNRRKKEVPRYSQVANAVPPLLAEAIGLVLLDMAKAKQTTGTAKQDRRSGSLSQERAMAV